MSSRSRGHRRRGSESTPRPRSRSKSRSRRKDSAEDEPLSIAANAGNTLSSSFAALWGKTGIAMSVEKSPRSPRKSSHSAMEDESEVIQRVLDRQGVSLDNTELTAPVQYDEILKWLQRHYNFPVIHPPIVADTWTDFPLGSPFGIHNHNDIETRISLSPFNGGLGANYTVVQDSFAVPSTKEGALEGETEVRQCFAIRRQGMNARRQSSLFGIPLTTSRVFVLLVVAYLLFLGVIHVVAPTSSLAHQAWSPIVTLGSIWKFFQGGDLGSHTEYRPMQPPPAPSSAQPSPIPRWE